MSAIEGIYSDVPLVADTSSVAEGLAELSRSGRAMLPVVGRAGAYVGMLSDQGAPGPGAACADEAEPVEAFRTTDAPATIMRILSERDTDTVPVVDNGGKLVGVADRQRALRAFAHLMAADAPGTTIAVCARPADYEVGRLAQTMELAGARILSLLTDRGGDRVVAYVKVAQTDPYPIVESLERHGYAAVALTGAQPGAAQDTARRNYEALMRYIDI